MVRLSPGLTVGYLAAIKKEATKGLALSIIMRLIFTSLPGKEYYSAPFIISDSLLAMFYHNGGTR